MVQLDYENVLQLVYSPCFSVAGLGNTKDGCPLSQSNRFLPNHRLVPPPGENLGSTTAIDHSSIGLNRLTI